MWYIKQVAGDLQATQINLMRHQRTELPTNRHNKKRRPTSKPKQYKAPKNSASNQVKKSYDNKKPHRTPDRCNKCHDSIHAQGFQCPTKKYQCKVLQQIWSLPQSMLPKGNSGASQEQSAETLKHTNYMPVPCMHRTVPITVIPKSPALMNHFAYSYKHKAIMLKVSRFQNLFIL